MSSSSCFAGTNYSTQLSERVAELMSHSRTSEKQTTSELRNVGLNNESRRCESSNFHIRILGIFVASSRVFAMIFVLAVNPRMGGVLLVSVNPIGIRSRSSGGLFFRESFLVVCVSVKTESERTERARTNMNEYEQTRTNAVSSFLLTGKQTFLLM